MKIDLKKMSSITGRSGVDCCACRALAATSTWKIDPQHSLSAIFRSAHGDLHRARRIQQSDGTVVLDDQDVTKSTVDVSIDVSTVDTREPARDKDLRSDHFFDVEHFPTMTFKSKKVEQVCAGQAEGHRRPDHSRHNQRSRAGR